jgi:hypothetical protein
MAFFTQQHLDRGHNRETGNRNFRSMLMPPAVASLLGVLSALRFGFHRVTLEFQFGPPYLTNSFI